MNDLFKITEQGHKWVVAWGGGPVRKNTNKEVLAGIALSCGKNGVTFLSSNNKTLTIDEEVYLTRTFYVSVAIENLEDIAGVAVDYKEEAEAFVDAVEKHIAWNILRHAEQTD